MKCLPAQMSAYTQEALLRGPVDYPAGANVVDHWMRDIGIAVLVTLAIEQWHLKATRNRAAKRPSASSIAAAALACRGHALSERRVETIYRDLDRVADRLSAELTL